MQKSLFFIMAAMVCGCTVNGSAFDQSDLTGAWMVDFIGEHPVIDRSPASMAFQNGGKLSGNASCNRFMGDYLLSGSQLTLGRIASTRKMCPTALMDQEIRFLAALGEVAEARLQNGLLLLLDERGSIRLKLSRLVQ